MAAAVEQIARGARDQINDDRSTELAAAILATSSPTTPLEEFLTRWCAQSAQPTVLLLADHGFNAYSTLIETRSALAESKPDLVQRFVDASIVGWYNYLYGDNAPGNALIKKTNPEMTDDLLAYSVEAMKRHGIVDSGDALRDGIGAMSDARMADFFSRMVRAGVTRRDIDYRKAYTLRFVNKGVGLNLRPRN